MVPTYDWAEYLGRFFVKIQGIKSLHHFHFAASEPGVVSVQMFQTSKTEKHTILANTDSEPKKGVLPSKITPKGLSLERKWYLYNKIREYCTESTKDIVCPYPGPGPCPPSILHPLVTSLHHHHIFPWPLRASVVLAVTVGKEDTMSGAARRRYMYK